MSQEHLAVYEVFVRSARGLDHKHVGSLHAESPEHALMYARDCYIRRSEGVSIWVVESKNITASQDNDTENFVEPMDDKPYRHATHYVLPDSVNNM
ncbi:1,2-phenylacetyl-CoA epoxidase subunit PaaB [Aliikangiella sp. G2MR2-5]|uniref:1,2-phenylacetyl-CoA epoxidase subunit PaaB n=1 Tax=Aliikangiella sp. G2MR2-5 TaxID=2788943 RepID=UPI0018A89BAD|nr:1,2-phenylacetyl-CoA epoxidase subunit PaaB [Aliikangiella sp. G2MR2-5]